MKSNKILSLAALACTMLATTACDPIEPKSDYPNAGTPITAEELTAALEVSQMANEEGRVEGDQYIIVKNNRPDIGGKWHLVYNGQETTYATDNDTIIAAANGQYQLYYQGISEYQVVKSATMNLTVTNVFDEWSNYFTGAENKADAGKKKTWKFREAIGGVISICNNGACGGWNYYAPDWSQSWWGDHPMSDAADYEMVFYFDDNKVTSSDETGAVKYTGMYSFTHDAPNYWDPDANNGDGACGVLGQITFDIPLIGSQWDDCRAQKAGEPNVFWVLQLTDKLMTLYHPDSYDYPAAWSNCGWFIYLQAVD